MNDESRKDGSLKWGAVIVAAVALVAVFVITKYVPADSLDRMGHSLPLPAFTFVIALVDGFNPCNLFVLTLLLGFLVSASSSRFRIYIVGYTFVIVVALFYFLFMVAWLNIFRYLGFVDPIRIAIAIIALAAGLINCKELFFFKRGVSLTIQDRHKGILYRRARRMKDVIVKGTLPVLIASSAVLAIFSSLVELPCTAGFPIIYTGILTGRYGSFSISYYMYLVYYNAVYVLPLVVVIFILGFLLRARTIGETEVRIVKFVGGLIMIILGVVLLANPGLLVG